MIVVKESFTKTIMVNFGEWLRNARKERGYSLRQLEERINKVCTFGYLNQLELGEKGKKGHEYQPDIEIVEALAVALDKPIDEARLAAGYAPIKRAIPPRIAQLNWEDFEDWEIQEIIDFANYIKTRPRVWINDEGRTVRREGGNYVLEALPEDFREGFPQQQQEDIHKKPAEDEEPVENGKDK